MLYSEETLKHINDAVSKKLQHSSYVSSDNWHYWNKEAIERMKAMGEIGGPACHLCGSGEKSLVTNGRFKKKHGEKVIVTELSITYECGTVVTGKRTGTGPIKKKRVAVGDSCIDCHKECGND